MEKDKTVEKLIRSKENERTFFEAEDMFNTLIQFLRTENYKKMVESVDTTTVESAFRSGMMMAPSIIYANCRKFHGVPVPIQNLRELVEEATDAEK